MKKLAIFGLTAMLALAPASALAAKKAVRQEMQGDVALATPYPADSTCFTRLSRVEGLYAGGAANGIVGYHFDVDPKTANKNFQLHVTGGGDDTDLDIVFYANFGAQDDPTTAPAFAAFETRESGGEIGKVPAGMTKAIVCMAAGSQASFHYMAGKGISAKL